MLKIPIYLDNHATTRVDPRVVAAMTPYWTEIYGNAGSTTHAFGWEARDAVRAARERIASSIGARASEIVFTSGATESDNSAIFGIAERLKRRGDHILSVRTEHKAVLDPLRILAGRGFDVTLLEVEPADSPRAGFLDPQRVADALRDDTCLVSVMAANNEIGVLHDIAAVAAICRARRAVALRRDAGDRSNSLRRRRAGSRYGEFLRPQDLWPEGNRRVVRPPARRRRPFNAAPIRRRPRTRVPQRHGRRAGHRWLRDGARVGARRTPDRRSASAALRDRLFAGLQERVAGMRLNGPALEPPDLRLPNNLNVTFDGVHGESLIMAMRDVAVSSGSACTSANPEPSHVLKVLGLNEDLVRASLRFGLGRFTTAEEIDFAIDTTARAVAELRALG
ncbi:MAG: aminotransferase class V-fold PLP-dependent enzyme [Pirellulales bacterium]